MNINYIDVLNSSISQTFYRASLYHTHFIQLLAAVWEVWPKSIQNLFIPPVGAAIFSLSSYGIIQKKLFLSLHNLIHLMYLSKLLIFTFTKLYLRRFGLFIQRIFQFSVQSPNRPKWKVLIYFRTWVCSWIGQKTTN